MFRDSAGHEDLTEAIIGGAMPVGLLMNFNVPLLKQGTHRIVRPDLLMRTE